MPEIKLNNSELKIMHILWECGSIPARQVALEAAARQGWNKNTTYTILKGLVEKGYVRRDEPNFVCVPLLAIEQVRRSETRGLIDRLFGGSPDTFLATFFQEEQLNDAQLEEIRRMIEKGPKD